MRPKTRYPGGVGPPANGLGTSWETAKYSILSECERQDAGWNKPALDEGLRAHLAGLLESAAEFVESGDVEQTISFIRQVETHFGDISLTTGRSKTRKVTGYVRKNGTIVREHARSERGALAKIVASLPKSSER